MEDIVIILIRGIGVGAIFALVAMSFNIVHRSSGILSFAQGNMFILAGLFAFLMLPSVTNSLLWIALLPIVAIAVGLLVAFQGYITLLPLRSSVEQLSWMVTTLAAAIVIGATILIAQGTSQLAVQSPFSSARIFGIYIPTTYVMVIILALLWYFGLRWFHTRTITGLAISAIAQDVDAARAAGINVRRLQITAFLISGVIVGSTGFVAAPVIAIANDSGIGYMINGFIAAVVGGLGSNLGSLLAGVLVGVISFYSAYFFGGEFQNAVSLALLIGVLMIRPQGVFGHAAARRV